VLFFILQVKSLDILIIITVVDYGLFCILWNRGFWSTESLLLFYLYVNQKELETAVCTYINGAYYKINFAETN
jgi:hypothetical protein